MPSIFTAMHEWEKRRNRIDPPLSRSLPLCLSSSSLIIVVSGQKRAYEWFIWSYHSKVVERVFREYFASIYRQRGRDRDISGEKGRRKKREEKYKLSSRLARAYIRAITYISRDTRHRSHLVLSPVECSGSTPFPISPSSTEFCLVMYLNYNGDDECITFPGIFFFPFFPLSLPLVLLIQRVFHANSSLRYLFRGGERSPPSFLYL